MRRLPVLALLAVAALLAGCAGGSSDSSDDFSGEQAAVAEAVEALETAAGNGDEEEVCNEVLAKELAAQVKAGSQECVTLLSQSLDDTDSFELEVDRVDVSGNTATAQVTVGTGDAERKTQLKLQRVGADWRISALS